MLTTQRWAEQLGLTLIPCKPLSKKPLGVKFFHGIYPIEEGFQKGVPNVVLLTGDKTPKGYFGVIDAKGEGTKTVERLFPELTANVKTGSLVEGYHHYFVSPTPIRSMRLLQTHRDQLEIRGTEGDKTQCCLTVPSLHPGTLRACSWADQPHDLPVLDFKEIL